MKNIYERGYVSEKLEKKRYEALKSFPFRVSQDLLGDNLKNKTVLDIGSGAGNDLGAWIENCGGKYMSFDIIEDYVRKQKSAGFRGVVGDAVSLPFKRGGVHITHARLVLMHMPPEKRMRVIQECVRTAKERAVFIEFDWSAFRGNSHMNAFVNFIRKKIFLENGSDPYYGAKLQKEVSDAVSGTVTEKKYSRKHGNYYFEFVPLIAPLRDVMENMNKPELLAEFDRLAEPVLRDAEIGEPETFFTPPDVVAVEVRKHARN